MGMIGDLFVKLGLKSDEFNKGIDEAKNKTSSFGSTMGKISGLIAGAFAVKEVIAFGKTSMEEFNKAEQGAMRLLTALKGNKQAQQELITQAENLQGITLFEDDETIAAQAAMAVMVKEADTIKMLMPLVQDLATAKGIDLSSAATMVGKAVAGSGAALQKLGIQVTGTAGSSERLKSVFDGLNQAVGGQAQAAAKVGTGAMTQMTNAWGNLKEAIGGVIAESKLFKYTIDSFKGYFEDQAAMINTKTIPAWQKFLNVITGNVKGFAEQERIAKETSDKWAKELAPKSSGTSEKPKMLTEAEQIKQRIDFLKQSIADTKVEMSTLDPKSDKWSEFATTLKSTKDELDSLTGATKAQELADKAAEQAKSNYVDMLIAQRIEEQRILELQGKKLVGQLSTKGSGIVGSNEDLKLSKGKVEVLPSNTKEAGLMKPQWDTVKDGEILRLKEANKKTLAEESEFTQQLNNILSSGLGSAAQTFGEGIAGLMSGDMSFKDFGKSLLGVVGQFLVQFGQLLISFAVAASGLQATMSNPASWPLALAAGIALVAIGSAISSFSKKSASSMGGGGSSTASGGGSYSSPSNGRQSQAEDNKVVFEIQGSKLVGVLNNADKRKLNLG